MIGTTQETIKTQTGVQYSYTTPSLQLLTESSFTAPTTYTLGNGITITQQGFDYIKPGQPLMYYIVAKNPNNNTEQVFIQSSLATPLFQNAKVYKLDSGTFAPMTSGVVINSTATPANTSIAVQLDLPASTTNNGEVKICIVTNTTPTYATTVNYDAPQSFTEHLNTLTVLPTDTAFAANTTSTETVVTEVRWAELTVSKTIYKTTGNISVTGTVYIESGDAFYYQLELDNSGNLEATNIMLKEVLEAGVAAVTGTNNAVKVEISPDNGTPTAYAEVSANTVTLATDVITITGLTVTKGSLVDTTWTPGKLYARIHFTAE